MKWDVIIVGAGAAGLSAAHYARYHRLSTLVIEQVSPGGQAMNIVTIPNFPGVDPETSGPDLVFSMEQRAENLGAEFRYSIVENIEYRGDDFIIHTSDALLEARKVILATGSTPKSLTIPGANELFGRGISTCAPCDGPFFRNKVTAVIGGGDSAVEDALFLSGICPEVHLLVRTTLTAQPYLVEELTTTKNIKVHLRTEVISFESEAGPHGFPVLKGIRLNNNIFLEVSGVFVLIGSVPRVPLIEPTSPQLSSGGYVVTDRWNETSIPGLFAIGGVRDQGFSQIIVGVSDGALAARRAYLQLLPIQDKE